MFETLLLYLYLPVAGGADVVEFAVELVLTLQQNLAL